VLFNNVTEDSPFFDLLTRRYRLDEDGLRRHYGRQEERFETGEITGVDAVLGAIDLSGRPIQLDTAGEIRRLYATCVRPNTALLDFLRLRQRAGSGYHLTLANNEAPDWDLVKNRLTGHLRLCDSLSSSWVLGLVKPRPEYFQAVLDQHRVAAGEAILVDDNPVCLSAAGEVGLATHRYTGTAALLELLGDLTGHR
jgi:FMN phosphatase YigB (HAD superfamily)